MHEADQEMLQVLSADCPDESNADDAMSFADLAGAASAPNGGSFTANGSAFPQIRDELMQHVSAIRDAGSQVPHPAAFVRDASAFPDRDAVAGSPPTTEPEPAGAIETGIHRLISWLDQHAHLHSTHQCAASVRRAMEAAGMSTADRPGDAGDYGPFLQRHGAQVIPSESYEPVAGDIAVFDKTEDHPAGHIQIFDGQHWVSDFVQQGFSPYRDQASTPQATVYRLS
ncbi:MAG TPA: hypothetical protein VGJ21_19085 [Terracidiphilus sp.]